MIDPVQGRILFYPVVMIPGRSGQGRARPGPFRWLKPCDTAREARDLVDGSLAHDGATLGFVVRFPERKGSPEILANYIRPESSRKLIAHYLDLCDLIDEEHPL